MRASRATCVQPDSVHLVSPDVIPRVRQDVEVKLEAVGLKMEGNRIIGLNKTVKGSVKMTAPLYDPGIHKPGDRVMVKSPYSKKMQEIVIPLVDADGYAYEE